MHRSDVYIATVLLEPNRWKPGKLPSYRVSEWIGRFASAGFNGMELWENHVAKSSSEEVELLIRSRLPTGVFNSYADFAPGDEQGQAVPTHFVPRLKAGGVKFNVGRDETLYNEYVHNVLTWAATLPPGTRLLCECHPGTVLEMPTQAAKAFSVWRERDIQAIIHPFNLQPKQLQEWFHHLGAAVTHAHVQLYRDGKMQRLERHLPYVKEILHIMREEGFRGSFTIEFTEGVGIPGERRTQLFERAVSDLHVLRECLG